MEGLLHFLFITTILPHTSVKRYGFKMKFVFLSILPLTYSILGEAIVTDDLGGDLSDQGEYSCHKCYHVIASRLPGCFQSLHHLPSSQGSQDLLQSS